MCVERLDGLVVIVMQIESGDVAHSGREKHNQITARTSHSVQFLLLSSFIHLSVLTYFEKWFDKSDYQIF